MPRYNIEHNGKYYVFSSIVDSIIEEFYSFEKLQEYRLTEYGKANFENEKSFAELKGNKMDFKKMVLSQIIGGNEEQNVIMKCFRELNDAEKNDVFKSLLEYIRELKTYNETQK